MAALTRVSWAPSIGSPEFFLFFFCKKRSFHNFHSPGGSKTRSQAKVLSAGLMEPGERECLHPMPRGSHSQAYTLYTIHYIYVHFYQPAYLQGTVRVVVDYLIASVWSQNAGCALMNCARGLKNCPQSQCQFAPSTSVLECLAEWHESPITRCHIAFQPRSFRQRTIWSMPWLFVWCHMSFSGPIGWRGILDLISRTLLRPYSAGRQTIYGYSLKGWNIASQAT